MKNGLERVFGSKMEKNYIELIHTYGSVFDDQSK